MVSDTGPDQSKLPRPVEGEKVPAVHIRNMLGKTESQNHRITEW